MSIYIIEFKGHTCPVMIHGSRETGYDVREYRGKSLSERFTELDDAYRFIKRHWVNRGESEAIFFSSIPD